MGLCDIAFLCWLCLKAYVAILLSTLSGVLFFVRTTLCLNDFLASLYMEVGSVKFAGKSIV